MPKTSSAPSELVFTNKGDKARLFTFDPAKALAVSYKLAEGSRVIRCGRAIACGVLALIAKDIAGHGQFSAWLKSDTVSDLNERTVRRYMAVARACMLAQKIMPRSMSKSAFLRWGYGDGEAVLPNGLPGSCPMWEAVVAYIGERSLTDIYHDEGILREREPHQVHTPATQTPAQAQQLELAGIISSIDSAKAHVTTLLRTGQWEKVPKDKRLEFILETVPAATVFGQHTDWSPQEHSAVERVAIALLQGVRESRKGGK